MKCLIENIYEQIPINQYVFIICLIKTFFKENKRCRLILLKAAALVSDFNTEKIDPVRLCS